MNLQLVSNSLLGGNIVTVMVRSLIRLKAQASAIAFRAKVMGLQAESNDYQFPEVCIGTIPVSVKKQETYALRAEATRHAIESRTNLTDHVILYPIQIDVAFEITNWDALKPAQANDLFMKLWKERTLVDLETAHTIVRNMILINYHANNTVPNWGALECTATFIQVNFVNIQALTITSDQVKPTDGTGGPDISKSASSKVNSGIQTPRDYVSITNYNSTGVTQ
jgi:hypothetical protein